MLTNKQSQTQTGILKTIAPSLRYAVRVINTQRGFNQTYASHLHSLQTGDGVNDWLMANECGKIVLHSVSLGNTSLLLSGETSLQLHETLTVQSKDNTRPGLL